MLIHVHSFSVFPKDKIVSFGVYIQPIFSSITFKNFWEWAPESSVDHHGYVVLVSSLQFPGSAPKNSHGFTVKGLSRMNSAGIRRILLSILRFVMYYIYILYI